MRFWSLKTTVVPEGSLAAADSTRTSRIKPRFIRFSGRERIWNVRLHARENHLSYALCTFRGTPTTETVILPLKIRKVRPQVRPVSGTEMSETSPHRRREPFLRKT